MKQKGVGLVLFSFRLPVARERSSLLDNATDPASNRPLHS
jgi:hypothetical protein